MYTSYDYDCKGDIVPRWYSELFFNDGTYYNRGLVDRIVVVFVVSVFVAVVCRLGGLRLG